VKAQNEQEFVIAATPSLKAAGSASSTVGYEGRELLFAGKVGTGFTVTSLKSLHQRFQALKILSCPLPICRRADRAVLARESRQQK
jgi:ATP-dependent DNA ligase